MSNIDRLVGQVIASGALTKAERVRRREEAKQARKTMRRKEQAGLENRKARRARKQADHKLTREQQ